MLEGKFEKFIPKEPPEGKEELPPNVVIVETEKAKFRIIYGKHDYEQNPEHLGEKADGLMLESDNFDYSLSKQLVEEKFIKYTTKLQYRKIIEKAKDKGIPIFLGDIINPVVGFLSLLRLRNHLFAQKLECIAKSLETQKRKPEIAIVIGAGHKEIEEKGIEGIEGALEKSDEERVKLIDKRLSETSPSSLTDTRERIAIIARFDFNEKEDKWELTDRFKDPHLAKIEK